MCPADFTPPSSQLSQYPLTVRNNNLYRLLFSSVTNSSDSKKEGRPIVATNVFDSKKIGRPIVATKIQNLATDSLLHTDIW